MLVEWIVREIVSQVLNKNPQVIGLTGQPERRRNCVQTDVNECQIKN